MEDEKDIGRGRKEVNNNGTKHHVLWFVGSCLLPFAIIIVQQTAWSTVKQLRGCRKRRESNQTKLLSSHDPEKFIGWVMASYRSMLRATRTYVLA